MSNDEKKVGFFKKVLKSVKDFDKYNDFVLEKTSDAIKYALKLILIFTAIISIVLTYRYIQGFNKIFSYVKDELPYFKFEDNILSFDMEKEEIIETNQEGSSQVLIIDTKSNIEDIEKYNQQINSHNIAILILKDRIILQNPELSAKLEYNLSDIARDYNIGNFDKNDLVNYVSQINVISLYAIVFVFLFMYLYPVYLITLLLDAVILALLGKIVAMLSRMNLKFAPSFNIGVHALTLPVILNMVYIIVNVFTGFEIKYFNWMYNVISYIYVIVAILIIKSDFINKRMELIKLEEEKEKISMYPQDEEKENEKKEEKDDKKDTNEKDTDEKNKKNEEDNNLDSESPEGSNA